MFFRFLLDVVVGLLLVPLCASALSFKELNFLTPPFKLAPLPYPANSLEVAIDEETMKVHHGFHHQAYVNNLNKAIGEDQLSLAEIFEKVSTQPEALRNNAGGHWNHSFFWSVLTPDKKKNVLPARLKKEIEKNFQSLDKFKEAFEEAAAQRFGSGWAWLIRTAEGKLKVTSTANQDNPLMDIAPDRGLPIFGVDVWEHAYYLRYKNRRGDYLKNFWQIVNWAQVDSYNEEAKNLKRGGR